MKSIIRNFLFVLKRFKTASILNILGLSVAFAAFIVMLIHVNAEYNFDRCHPNADRIFRIDLVSSGSANYILPRAFADAAITSSPHIEKGTILTPVDEWLGDNYVSVEDGAQMKGFREPFETCYSDITHIFGFRFTEGDPDCLKDPEKVIIPQSMAKLMFGKQTAVGKQLHLKESVWTKGQQDLTIGGVYEDFPVNTQIKNVIYTQIDNSQKNDWMSQNYVCYVLFDNKAEAAKFEKEFNKTFDFSVLGNSEKTSIHLMPLTDIYFSQTGFRSGNINTVRILLAIALLIIIIAAINYMNFSIAMTPIRIRSLNIQKVLGSSITTLRVSLVSEAVIITFISWAISLIFVLLAESSKMLSLFNINFLWQNHIPLLLLTGLIALLIGLASGLYPAFYATSFKPALALKGNFGLSPAGRKLRITLIGVQYVISIALIVAAVFVQKQNHYLQNFNQGFDKDHVAIVSLSEKIYTQSRDLYVNQLKAYNGIDDVAFAKQKLGASDAYTGYGFMYKNKTFGAYTLEVSENFLDVMKIPVTAGRNFLPSDTTGSNIVFVMNRPLQKQLNIQAGETIEMNAWNNSDYNVVGMTGDVKFTSLRQGQDNILFMVGSSAALPVSYIRLKKGADISAAIKYIRSTIAQIDPTFPVEIEFYDKVFEHLYQKEESLNKDISALSLLAILISVAGIFGLVLFETQYRRKEIGIRKVVGSGTGEILLQFNKTYLRIMAVCFVLAVPVAYYGISRWLENFAYKIHLDWWVFLLAGLFVAIITAITVTWQSYKIANINPAEVIKNE